MKKRNRFSKKLVSVLLTAAILFGMLSIPGITANASSENFTDDFNRADSTSLGSDWNNSNGAGSITGGKLTVTGTGSADVFLQNSVSLDGADDETQYISIDLEAGQLNDDYSFLEVQTGLLARINGNSAYAMMVAGRAGDSSGLLYLYRIENGQRTELYTTEIPWYNHSQCYRLSLSVKEDISGNAFVTGNILNLATGAFHTASGVDASPLASGTVGIFCGGTNLAASATFDNFYYSTDDYRFEDIPPVLEGNFEDDFNLPSLGKYWNNSNNTGSISGGKLAVTQTGTLGNFLHNSVKLKGVNSRTQYVSIDLEAGQLDSSSVETWEFLVQTGLLARINGTSAYAFRVDGRTDDSTLRLYLLKIDNGQVSDLKYLNPPGNYNHSQCYRLSLSVTENANGDAVVTGNVLNLATDTFYTVSAVDQTPLASGTVGVFGDRLDLLTSPTPILYDDFYYSPEGYRFGDVPSVLEGDFEDGFDRANLGEYWNNTTGAGSITSGKLAVTQTGTLGDLLHNSVRLKGVNSSTQYISIDLEAGQLDSSSIESWNFLVQAGLLAHLNGTSAYVLRVDGRTDDSTLRLYLLKIDSGVTTTLNFNEALYNHSQRYRLSLSVTEDENGYSVITANIMNLATETFYTVSAIDETPLASGTVGVFGDRSSLLTNPTPVLYDNFYYSPDDYRDGDTPFVLNGNFTDNFDRANSTDLGQYWNNTNGARSIESGKLKNALPKGNTWESEFNYPTLLRGVDAGEQYVSVDIEPGSLPHYWDFAGLWARYQNRTGYAAQIDNGTLRIFRASNGSMGTAVESEAIDSYASSRRYRLALSVTEENETAFITATVLDYIAGSVVATLEYEDQSPLPAGTAGVYGCGWEDSGNPSHVASVVRFDDFYYSPTTPGKWDTGIDSDFNDDFSRADGGLDSKYWRNMSDAGGIDSEKLRITIPSESWHPNISHPLLLNALNSATQYVSVDLEAGQLENGQGAGLWVRYSATQRSGYYMFIYNGNLYLRKMVDDEEQPGGQMAGFYYNSTHRYRLEMSIADDINGDAVVKASVMDISAGTIVAKVTQTDNDPLVSGTVGVFCDGTGTSALFDNFYYSPEKPRNLPETELLLVLQAILLKKEDASSFLPQANVEGDSEGNVDILDLLFLKDKLNKSAGTMQGGAEQESAALRSAILGANDNLSISGQKYYISPNGNDSSNGKTHQTAWKTLNALKTNALLLRAGTAVLFERGGVWRQTEALTLRSGVTYGAYTGSLGTAKPAIYGSSMNYAEAQWSSSSTANIWTIQMPTSAFVGNITFNHGEEVGIFEYSLGEVDENLDYYFNTANKTLYLYLDTGSPSAMYSDIEIGVNRAIFTGPSRSNNITIDNICMKYTGAGGVEFNNGNTSYVTITNCEVAYVGGTLMWDGSSGTRGGNGIGFWNNANNIKVSNNWVYQVFDAGISPQGNAGQKFDQIEISNNLIEYCTWSYEQWVGNNQGQMSNTKIKNNIMRFAGYGWGQQRPDSNYNSHINFWSYSLGDCISNYSIEGNIFDLSSHALIAWHWDTGNPAVPGLTVSGNTFYQSSNVSSWAIWYGSGTSYFDKLYTAVNQQELETAVAAFDSTPAHVEWLD